LDTESGALSLSLGLDTESGGDSILIRLFFALLTTDGMVKGVSHWLLFEKLWKHYKNGLCLQLKVSKCTLEVTRLGDIDGNPLDFVTKNPECKVLPFRADPDTDHPFKTGSSCSACPEGFRRCESGMCAPESQHPVEPEFQLDVFENEANNDENEGPKEAAQNMDKNSVNNPYAPASGPDGQILDNSNTDGASKLRVLF
uniref:LAM_G_DOMAIN domain-containing protein n=1 Tax=Rodentolepis nana TaxID=102285 RepID=A0A0R3TBX8_RODNA